MKNNRLLLTIKYTILLSDVFIITLLIIYIICGRINHNVHIETIRFGAVTKANLLLNNNVDISKMQHIQENNSHHTDNVSISIYTKDFKKIYDDLAVDNRVKLDSTLANSITEQGLFEFFTKEEYDGIGILYDSKEKKGNEGEYIVIAIARKDHHKENMRELRNTLIIIFFIVTFLMAVISYKLANITIRPIEQALHLQKMFASNVSHELRTPLSAIKGELDLALQKERSVTDYQNCIRRTLNDVSHMSGTVIGLLNLTQAEYDLSQVKTEVFRIDELLMDVTEEIMRANPEYNIEISYTEFADTDKKVSIEANREIIHLAFRNLIENNCKYSSNKTCNIVIHTEDGLLVSFSDQGQGMSSDEKEKIFQPFYRGQNDSTGHGIGMNLVKRIIKLHNFSIDIQSEEGVGTKFNLKLK